MRNSIIALLIATAQMSAAIAASPARAANCVKQVFAVYCLGGTPAELIRLSTPESDKYVRGIRIMEFDDSRTIYKGRIEVMAYANTIFSIKKTFEDGSDTNYVGLLVKLYEKYGPPKKSSPAIDFSSVIKGDDWGGLFDIYSSAGTFGRATKGFQRWDFDKWQMLLDWGPDGLSIDYAYTVKFAEFPDREEF